MSTNNVKEVCKKDNLRCLDFLSLESKYVKTVFIYNYNTFCYSVTYFVFIYVLHVLLMLMQFKCASIVYKDFSYKKYIYYCLYYLYILCVHLLLNIETRSNRGKPY